MASKESLLLTGLMIGSPRDSTQSLLQRQRGKVLPLPRAPEKEVAPQQGAIFVRKKGGKDPSIVPSTVFQGGKKSHHKRKCSRDQIQLEEETLLEDETHVPSVMTPEEEAERVENRVCIRRHSKLKLVQGVTFAEEAKDHDGPVPENALFDSLMYAYFLRHQTITEEDVLRVCDHDVDVVNTLHASMTDLIDRLQAAQGSQGGVPVLSKGGGYNTRLTKQHLPYLHLLLYVVNVAVSKINYT